MVPEVSEPRLALPGSLRKGEGAATSSSNGFTCSKEIQQHADSSHGHAKMALCISHRGITGGGAFRFGSIPVSGLKKSKNASVAENPASSAELSESSAPAAVSSQPAIEANPCEVGPHPVPEDLAEDEELLDCIQARVALAAGANCMMARAISTGLAQVNIHHAKAASAVLTRIFTHQHLGLALVQEPWVNNRI